MTELTSETRIALLEEKQNALYNTVKALKDERDRALMWGVLTLGAAVIGMASWIWNFIVQHIVNGK